MEQLLGILLNSLYLHIHGIHYHQKMFHTQNISDCYVENKITSSKNFNFSTCKISWKTQPPFHDPNPSFVALLWEKSHSTVITSLKRQGRWKQILHVVSPGDFSQRASAPKCVFFFRAVKWQEVGSGLEFVLFFFGDAAPNCIINYLELWHMIHMMFEVMLRGV